MILPCLPTTITSPFDSEVPASSSGRCVASDSSLADTVQALPSKWYTRANSGSLYSDSLEYRKPHPKAQTSFGAKPQTLATQWLGPGISPGHRSTPLQTPLLFVNTGGSPKQPHPPAKVSDGEAAQPASTVTPKFSVLSARVHDVPS